MQLDFTRLQPLALDGERSAGSTLERPQGLYVGHRNSWFIRVNVTMTTNGTAATRRTTLPFPFAAAGLTIALALGGCEGGASLLGGANQPPLAVAPQPPAVQTSVIAIPPVLGVPEATSKDIVAQIGNGLDKTRFQLAASPTTPADFTLRGYATAAKDKAAPTGKLSYFFDVVDKSGKTINRIAGEEVLAAAPSGKDVWQAVTPAITTSVAIKTVGSFQSMATAPAVATAAPPPATPSYTPPPPSPATPQLAAVQPAAAPAAPTTGSIDRQTVTAVVPSVTGAPGDGSNSLSAALQRELSKNGVAMGDGTTPQAYRVEGKVAVGADANGKQPIQIDWVVKDPQGKKLGTVSQKNEIPQGSLDGAWGKTADAAAAAAAQGILKLIPGAKATQ